MFGTGIELERRAGRAAVSVPRAVSRNDRDHSSTRANVKRCILLAYSNPDDPLNKGTAAIPTRPGLEPLKRSLTRRLYLDPYRRRGRPPKKPRSVRSERYQLDARWECREGIV